MSTGKFASLTAGLLVRKGDAGPSSIAPPPAVVLVNTTQLQPSEPPSLAQLLRGNAPPLPPDAGPAMSAPPATSPPTLKIVPHAPVEAPQAPVARESHSPAVPFRCEAHKGRARKAAPVATAGGSPPPSAPAKPRRIVATLTAAEYDTLGLMAVKKGTTRNQLLRNALDEYMALLADEYGVECQCIYTGCSCE